MKMMSKTLRKDSRGLRASRTATAVTLAAVLTAFGTSGLASASQKPKTQTFNITVGYAATNILLTPFWVGMDQGIFAKAGLNVKLVSLGSSPITAAAIGSNSITIGSATPIGLIPAFEAGESIQAISEMENGLPQGIVVRNAYAAAHGISAKSTPQQIAKALVGSTQVAGGQSIVGQTNVIMNSLGVQNSQYKTVVVSNSAADVTTMSLGQADWYMASYPTPFQSVANGSGFIALNANNTEAFNTKQLNNVIVANTTYAAAHPALMKKIVKAISVATIYTDHHEKQIIPTVTSHLPGFTAAQISKSLAIVDWATTPLQNENIWRSSVAFDIKSGQLKPPVIVKENGIWTNKYA